MKHWMSFRKAYFAFLHPVSRSDVLPTAWRQNREAGQEVVRSEASYEPALERAVIYRNIITQNPRTQSAGFVISTKQNI